MKTLRRRVIIRQYDYNKLIKEVIPRLYHVASFEPITLKELEHEHLMMVLSDQGRPMLLAPQDHRVDLKYYEYPRSYLYQMQKMLYDKHYVEWFSEYDKDGYMWIQARKNTPRTMLGWGTFEYYYE